MTKFKIGLTIIVITIALSCAASLVLSESEQASWNAHCLRDNALDADVRACQSAYQPGMYGK
jgi:hypothetical protein